jgi:hypothetical protein
MSRTAVRLVGLSILFTLLATAGSAAPLERGERGPRGHGRGPGPELGGPRGLRPLPLHELFPARESDFAAVDAEERAELLAFAKERLPRIGRALERLKRWRPAAFERRIQDAAPRLRQLQRIYAFDEEVGDAVTRHAVLFRRVHEAHRAYHRAHDEDPVKEAQALGALRAALAKIAELETLILEKQVASLEATRDERIAARVDSMLGGRPPAAALPPEIRDLVERHATADASEQEAIRAELTARATEHELDEEAAWRERLEYLKAQPTDVVDRRLEWLKEQPPRRGRPRGPGERGFRGGRADGPPRDRDEHRAGDR